MLNIPITMSKLRTIIRLYEDRMGLKTVSTMARSSRNTVKKYIVKWNALGMSYEEFQHKSDAELNMLFCIAEDVAPANPRQDLPSICKELGKKGMTTFKQLDNYISEHPDGYSLTQFRVAVQRYRLINNPSMRMEHKAGDKMFVDYTGAKLWIYPPGERPRAVLLRRSSSGHHAG